MRLLSWFRSPAAAGGHRPAGRAGLLLAALAVAALALAAGPAWAAVDPLTGRWRPGIGDPTVMGWLTVLAYFAATALCIVNVLAARRTRINDRFWLVMAVMMGALALNKQLDLQTWFTQVGRDMAMAQGWYAQRRLVQVTFISVLCATAIGCTVWLRHWLAASWRAYRVVCVGVALLWVFIIARAATFHHVDVLIGLNLGALHLNHVLELGALATVMAGAWRWRQAHRRTVREFFLRQMGLR